MIPDLLGLRTSQQAWQLSEGDWRDATWWHNGAVGVVVLVLVVQGCHRNSSPATASSSPSSSCASSCSHAPRVRAGDIFEIGRAHV